jgi:hypothetical protein
MVGFGNKPNVLLAPILALLINYDDGGVFGSVRVIDIIVDKQRTIDDGLGGL